MSKQEKKILRYVVKANGEIVDWSFSKRRAFEIAFKFYYECMNQDEPFYPDMRIVEEFMKVGEK